MGIRGIFRTARLLVTGAVIGIAAIKGVQYLSQFSVTKDKVTSVERRMPAKPELEPMFPTDRLHRPCQLLYRQAYTVSYNRETKCPNWVFWELTREQADGTVRRPDYAFHEDGEVPRPKAQPEDYRGSGFDRGHMCPAGDNKWDADAMYESFLMTNVCPQDKDMNAGTWNAIEMRCRYWAKKHGRLLIVCGPLFLKEHKVIGKNRIWVPEAFFKVVFCPEGTPKGIAFICRNKDKDCLVCTITEAEGITGYSFFPELDEDVAAQVKNQANLKDW